MKLTTIAAISLIWAAPLVHAQEGPSAEIAQRAVERRAVEAVIWGMPAVNYDLMLQEMLDATDGEPNQVIYWGRPLDWMNQTLTPNPDTLYFMSFFDTRDGPIVIEVPPANGGSLNGNIVTAWQKPLEDVGLLGVDKGEGGKFVILPPGYTEPVPEGYAALPSDTFGGFALIRSNLAEPRARGRGEVGRLRQADQGLSAGGGREPARDGLHRRAGRAVRFDHPLRRDLLRAPRPHRAGRALDRARPGDDRPAQDARHREGQAVQARRRDAGHARRRGGRGQGATSTTATTAAGERSSRAPTGGRRRRRSSHRPPAAGYTEPDAYPTDLRGIAYTYRLRRHQAARRRPVLPDRAPRLRRRAAGRREQLPADRAAGRAGRAILVGDGLRPPDPRARPAHGPRQPRLERERGASRTPTARPTSSSARPRRRARRRTGCRPTPRASSR